LETSAIVTGIRERLEAILAPPQGRYRPFVVDGDAVGWIDGTRAQRLAKFADVLIVDDDQVRFADGIVQPEARTEAMERVARGLAEDGLLSAWRSERYSVVREFGDAPRFELERCAARYFGIRTFAAHINGLVRTGDDIRMWLGRRSPHKAVDPGLLDNMVGGGIAAAAQSVNALRICRAHPRGLERETVYVHDLWLDPRFVPKGIDGEVAEFRLETLADAATIAGNCIGCDIVTADASLVIADCLIRCDRIAAGTTDYAALDALRRASLEPWTNT
jgi:hypothetical protein